MIFSCVTGNFEKFLWQKKKAPPGSVLAVIEKKKAFSGMESAFFGYVLALQGVDEEIDIVYFADDYDDIACLEFVVRHYLDGGGAGALHGDDVQAVFLAEVDFPDAGADKLSGYFNLADLHTVIQGYVIQEISGDHALAQTDGHIPLGIYHVGSQLL